MTANDLRGEAEVELGGETYRLKLTLDVIHRIENRTGVGWQALVTRAFAGELHLDDIAVILWAGIAVSYPAKEMDYECVADLVFAEGLIRITPAARNFILLQAVSADHVRMPHKRQEKFNGG